MSVANAKICAPGARNQRWLKKAPLYTVTAED